MMNEQELLRECKRLDSQGLYRAALQLLSEAIASTPSDQLFHERGVRHEHLGEYQMAWEDYSTAASLAPTVMRHWLSRGRLVCDRLGRAAHAVDDFRKAISADPGSPVPHQHLSLCYLLLGDPDTASQHAKRAIELDAMDAFSYYCLGQCRVAAGTFHSATKHLEVALQLDPHSSLYWQALGAAHLGTGDTAKARQCYQNAVEIEPSAICYIQLARILLDTGNAKEAMACLNSASSFDLGEAERALVSGYLELAAKDV